MKKDASKLPRGVEENSSLSYISDKDPNNGDQGIGFSWVLPRNLQNFISKNNPWNKGFAMLLISTGLQVTKDKYSAEALLQSSTSPQQKGSDILQYSGLQNQPNTSKCLQNFKKEHIYVYLYVHTNTQRNQNVTVCIQS